MMYKSIRLTAALAAVVSLAACGSESSSDQRDALRVVGSSTVYPFAKVVAENFARENPELGSPVIESTGSGAGIKLFCEGVGAQTPDIANASRRMKASELETCIANGVTNVTEIQVGLDGIAFAASIDGIDMNLTPEIVYRAIAANPYGEAQTAKNWSDIDPSLPNKPILVYGPPATSGTRDALVELVLMKGCESGAGMAELEESDEDRYEQVCTELRTDAAFVEQGEQDNLIVQKIEGNGDAVGIFGFSYLEENADRVKGLSMNGVTPTYENISNFSYIGARPLFIYVKQQHMDAIPGMAQFLKEWADSWGVDGTLAAIGLVPNPDDVMARSTAATTELPALTVADLK